MYAGAKATVQALNYAFGIDNVSVFVARVVLKDPYFLTVVNGRQHGQKNVALTVTKVKTDNMSVTEELDVDITAFDR